MLELLEKFWGRFFLIKFSVTDLVVLRAIVFMFLLLPMAKCVTITSFSFNLNPVLYPWIPNEFDFTEANCIGILEKLKPCSICQLIKLFPSEITSLIRGVVIFESLVFATTNFSSKPWGFIKVAWILLLISDLYSYP